MSAIDDYMRLREAILEFFLIICKELRIDEAVKQLDALLTKESAEKQFARSLSKRTDPLTDDEKRTALLTGDEDCKSSS